MKLSPDKFALFRLAFIMSASPRSAPRKFAPVRFAEPRSAPLRSAYARSALLRFLYDKFAPARSAPAQAAKGPGWHARAVPDVPVPLDATAALDPHTARESKSAPTIPVAMPKRRVIPAPP